ncbi:hypothetical protein QRX50_22350 [Amycolatopsis carbonis]|uniref:Uncharacterized protein n=1 Tax=Amycolatopsis carbonis TaxID=715471 RepID=A0A9Y2N048_9PSEU|nr:hypothetical protein [Amycolatopsis sp. 2-15]WIX83303.1 hypothetical protein QRX50_22350 [Amycolatopsis sp. 2-15]
MAVADERARQPRTLLEQKIWERSQSLSEFAESAESFARQSGEPGTLSERNLKRLVAGRRTDGTLVGRPRPATARLLERIFGTSIDELLVPIEPTTASADTVGQELRSAIATAKRIDTSVVAILRDQLAAVRQLDRKLGATAAYHEVAVKIDQVTQLHSYSLSAGTRAQLAALLAELSALAGWQALDQGRVSTAWNHYERAKQVAHESDDAAFARHVEAEQAFVLLDIGHAIDAVDLLAATESDARGDGSPLLRAWLAAAHGEALAASDRPLESLRAFDRAESLLPAGPSTDDGPYLVLDSVHLARWRGNALARIGEADAVSVLDKALRGLDPTFTRAEAGLRVDLATALAVAGEHDEANLHITKARDLATEIGSARQLRRLARLPGKC